MSGLLAGIATVLAALAARPDGPAAAQDAPAEAASASVRPAPVLDFTKPFDHAAYEAALGSIAEAFPDLMRVRSLGKSRGGRDLWLAVLADAEGGEPRKRPAAVVLTDLKSRPSGQVSGPEAALFVLESLLERARSDPEVRERLRRSAIYFLPAPDPDHAFLPAPPVGDGGDGGQDAAYRDCRLEENFPARWQPFGPDVRSPGPYALSEPESLALARFLLDRENLSTLLLLTREDEGASAVRPDAPPAPGSLRAYAREILALEVREALPWTGEPKPTGIGSAPLGFEIAASLAISVLDGLPRLACGPAKVERLRPDLWLLDLPLENRGTLPTLDGGSRRPGFPSVSMEIAGGRLVACALKESGSESYLPVELDAELVPIGHVDGLEVLAVRIVVQAEEGAELTVSFRSPRAGTAAAAAKLQ